jgi:hypothetical protein
MRGQYILDENGKPVPCNDLMKWGLFFRDSEKRIVKQERIGSYHVSTVFLGLDHSWGQGPPILWETMVFEDNKGAMDQEMDRCSGNREQAEAMHEAMVERVRAVVALSLPDAEKPDLPLSGHAERVSPPAEGEDTAQA